MIGHESLWDAHFRARLLRQGLSHAEMAQVVEMAEELDAKLADATSALRYIEQRYGRLSGVGWERVLS